uniref:Cytochrome c7-like domain-containing protein n=1 Tax=Anaerolinea thermolimosa TaxID=229919 RepID=A0A7C4KFE5_9CHLR
MMETSTMTQKFRLMRILPLQIGLGVFLAWLGLLIAQNGVVYAASSGQEQQPGNAVCLGCHQQPGQTMTLASGEQLYVSVDPAQFGKSAHAKAGVACAVCHTDIFGYPHPQRSAQTIREYTLIYKDTCKLCHADKYALDSVHRQAFESGNENAPICVDCHNPHTQVQVTDEQGNLIPEELGKSPEVCAKCHNAIYEEYIQSVHGEAAQQGNPDVPVCISCHGLHKIEDPTTAKFRLASPKLCGDCHSNQEIMAKYGLSTDVYNTYVSDFHGTTVTLFEKTSPDQPTNKAVCYDCHGVHSIRRVDDPQAGLEIKQNMLAACQRCHPDANENFPDSWLSHYTPSPTKYPVVYYVNLFYKFFIPTVLGVMGVLVLSDVGRRISMAVRRRSKGQNQGSKEKTQS